MVQPPPPFLYASLPSGPVFRRIDELDQSEFLEKPLLISLLQGRAALVALRKSGGRAGPLGRSFYKGGFEPKMTRREAALILEMPCVNPH